MKNYPRLFAMLLGAVLPLFGLAQTDRELLAQLLQEEQSSVEALALYPEPTRLAILEVSKYPEALIKLETLQGKTSTAFTALLDNYPKDVKEKVWDLTRYPGLLAAIVEGGEKQGTELERALQGFPKEIVPRAVEVSNRFFPLLVEADRLQREWDGAYGEMVAAYSPVTRDALQQLVDLPEVLSLLTDNIRLTVLVGDLYQKNPTWLLRQMDSLSLVVAEARTKELDDWKKNLEADPQAEEELQQSAQAYADEYGYDDEYYAYEDDLYYDEDDRNLTLVEYHYYHYNYPYWFGYPHWYPYPRWRPYPYTYDWGFYWGPGQAIIIVDMPSYWFVHWYFDEPWHHFYYPNLSSHYTKHYYGHRGSSSSVTTNMRNWQDSNRDIVTDEWLDKARTNPTAFKEYGRFETERERYNQEHPTKPVSPNQFLDKKRKQYPDLSQAVERKQEKDKLDGKGTEPKLVEPQKPRDATVSPRKEEVSPVPRNEQISPAPRKEVPQKQPSINLPKVEKAQKHHQDAWEKTKRETSPRPQVDRPKTVPPKLTPQKQPSTTPKVDRKPSTPRKKG